MSRSGAIVRRVRGALEIFEHRREEIIIYLDGTYGIPSRSVANHLWHVDLDHGTCECPDQAVGGRHCAHLFCAEIARAKGVPRGVARPVPHTNRKGGECQRRCRSAA